jgi:hypothetical protein
VEEIMLRRIVIAGLLMLTAILAACGSGEADTPAAAGAAAQGTPRGFFGGGEMPLSMRLPAGTLMLEQTALAVSPQQAQELLPLWQMVRSLQGSATASQVELEATFDQIEDAMTTEQLAAIEDMDQDDMRALFEELGVGRQGGDSDGDEEGRRGFGLPEGMVPPGAGQGGPGMGPGRGEGMPGMGPGGFGDVDPEAAATAMAERGGPGMGFGSGLTDAVIELLETRAAES